VRGRSWFSELIGGLFLSVSFAHSAAGVCCFWIAWGNPVRRELRKLHHKEKCTIGVEVGVVQEYEKRARAD